MRLAWIRTAASGAAAESGEGGKCDRVRAWRRAGPEAGDGWAVAEASARRGRGGRRHAERAAAVVLPG